MGIFIFMLFLTMKNLTDALHAPSKKQDINEKKNKSQTKYKSKKKML